VYYVKGN